MKSTVRPARPTFLQTRGTDLVLDGRTVTLTGVNLGGWLMMEGYILHSPNRPEKEFKRQLAKTLGAEALKGFEKDFRDHFITEKDLAAISGLGFNCVRVPFHYRLIEPKRYSYDAQGLIYLDRLLDWCRRHRLWAILDLHAAAGAQNHDWHSDSDGAAGLWTIKSFQDRTVELWAFLADRYRDNPAVAGYDILNEAVVPDAGTLNRFYRRVVKAIRDVDRRHILFIEGNTWATDLDCLDRFDDDNAVLSFHFYPPLDFTFNFVPGLRYPYQMGRDRMDRRALESWLAPYGRAGKRHLRPLFVGEFGVNARQGFAGEDLWLRDALDCFKDMGCHWTYWTYKAVKNNVFPDGILSYRANPPWVNRQGPLCGWDQYARLWPERRRDLVRSWKTASFQTNDEILKVLQKGVSSDRPKG